jgi:hypothetical protein
MRHKRFTQLLLLIIVISLAQACRPQVEINDPLQTQETTPEQAPTNTATEIFVTKTPKLSPTSTYAYLGTIDVDPKGNSVTTETKSASLVTEIEPVEKITPSDSEVVDQTEQIPTNTSPVSTIPPEPTETQKPPESTAFAGCPNGCTFHPDGCDIKGNISIATGEKIYHVPGGEFYDACVISPDYGERWFCTEQEAIDNGWRKSKY